MEWGEEVSYESVMRLIKRDGDPYFIVQNMLHMYPILKFPYRMMLKQLYGALVAMLSNEGLEWSRKHREHFLMSLQQDLNDHL